MVSLRGFPLQRSLWEGQCWTWQSLGRGKRMALADETEGLKGEM